MGDETGIVCPEKKTESVVKVYNIPIWQKYTLSVEEAAYYFRIGRAKLRRLIDENENAPYILWNGNRPQIKRKMFEEYIDKTNVI